MSLKEYQAILTLYIGTILSGLHIGLSSVAIDSIQREAEGNQTFIIPSIEASKEDLSWIASTFMLGMVFGSLIGGFLGSRFGPKRTIVVFCFLESAGSILVATAPYLSLLILGRILAGAAASVNMANISLLIAQYSSKERRGAFLSIFSLMAGAGSGVVFMLGTFLPWRIIAAIPALFILIEAAALVVIPESPIWLLGHKNIEETKKALEWLRDGGDVTEELEELKKTQEKQQQALGMLEALKNLSRSDIYKPFLLININSFLLIFTGTFAIIAYAVQVFQESGLGGGAYIGAILVGIIRIISGIIGIFLVHRLPRKLLGNISAGIMGISMAVLGAIMYVKSVGGYSSGLKILSVICIIVFMFAFGIGVGPLQMVWIGELMPPEYKVLVGLAVSLAALDMFIFVQIFPTLLAYLKPYGTYWMCSAFCFSLNIFYFGFMPETKGMSLLEIKKMFSKERNDGGNAINMINI